MNVKEAEDALLAQMEVEASRLTAEEVMTDTDWFTHHCKDAQMRDAQGIIKPEKVFPAAKEIVGNSLALAQLMLLRAKCGRITNPGELCAAVDAQVAAVEKAPPERGRELRKRISIKLLQFLKTLDLEFPPPSRAKEI